MNVDIPNSTVIVEGSTIGKELALAVYGLGIWRNLGISCDGGYVANGVTGTREWVPRSPTSLGLRDATASGRLLGSRMFVTGPILDDAPGDWPFRMRVKTVDMIKVHDLQPAFFAIADEARRQHLPLAGHVPLGLTVEQAVDARPAQHRARLERRPLENVFSRPQISAGCV